MILDGSFRGFPLAASPVPLTAVPDLRWTFADLPQTFALLRTSALDANRAWMRAFCARTGAKLAPHAKTTMSPELFALQVEDGVWGLTVATAQQAAVALRSVPRVLHANPLVGAPERTWARGRGLWSFVDSRETVALLDDADVFVEIGTFGGRCGCRTVEQAVTVTRAAAERGLRVRGVAAFEGLLPEDQVPGFLAHLSACAEACRPWCGPEPILSAGGSLFHDLVAGIHVPGFDLLLRSGCYLTSDHGIYGAGMRRLLARRPELAALGETRPALEVWATVLSRPEPGRVILSAGKRDFGVDAGLPVPLAEGRVAAVNDQHTHLVVEADSRLRVGDRVGLGITHPCTTSDRWSLIWLADDAENVVGAVRTEFG